MGLILMGLILGILRYNYSSNIVVLHNVVVFNDYHASLQNDSRDIR